MLFATACAAGCTHTEGKQSDVKQPLISDSLMKMISIDTVRMMPIGSQLKLSGEVGYDENHVVKVFPNSSGQVVQVNVSFGDYVHKGQTLAVIRSADVAGNYSDLTNAESDVRIAKRQYENARSLYEGGISSQREYEEAKENHRREAARPQGRCEPSQIGKNCEGKSGRDGEEVGGDKGAQGFPNQPLELSRTLFEK